MLLQSFLGQDFSSSGFASSHQLGQLVGEEHVARKKFIIEIPQHS